MNTKKRPRLAFAAILILLVAGCSSSFGGGSPPSRTHVIVVPEGQRAVCNDGTPPPCR